jgi:hypothetical protein
MMLIDLVATSFLQASKFSLPFRLSHRDKIGMLFTIPSKEDFGVRRVTRRRGCQRGFTILGFDVSFMSSTSCCLKETLCLIKTDYILFDMIKESREGGLVV